MSNEKNGRASRTFSSRALLTASAISITAMSSIGPHSTALALEDDSLTVWVGTNRDVDLVNAIGKRFEEELGIAVKAEEVDPVPDKYQQSAASGDGPDIVMWAHDRFGEWAKGGLIVPVSPSGAVNDQLIESAWDAVSFDGKVWGYPIAVEAVGLVYNKDLIAEPPASFEEIAELAVPEGVAPIMWDYNNTYFTFPMLAANGGFAFQKKDGSYDGTSTGVNNEGAVQGAAMLAGLIESGTMAKGVDYGVMDGAMKKGEVAMVINGPWSWNGFKESGINFAVAPLPSVNGNPSVPFIGVQALAINAASKNQDLAVEFIENYLMSDEGLAEWNANGALGTLVDMSSAEQQSDPNVAATLDIAKSGVPMPSNPEMGAFWAAMEPALANITSGAQEPQAALDDAATRILGQ